MGVNHSVTLRKTVFSEGYVGSTLIPSGVLVLLYSFIIFSKKYSTRVLTPLLLVISFLILINLLKTEFWQIIFSLGKTSSIEAKISAMQHNSVHTAEYMVIEKNLKEDLVVNHFTILLVFLKFWHVVFITLFITFKQLRYIEYKKLSYDSVSSMLYNATFLVWFNLLISIIEKKKLMYYFLLKPSEYYIYQDSLKSFIEILQYIVDLIVS